MTDQDKADCCNALREWFKSQGLEPYDAMNVFALFAGFMIAQNAKSAPDLVSLVDKLQVKVAFHAVSEYVRQERTGAKS